MRAPIRAEASAASQPAWPAPTTTTSYVLSSSLRFAAAPLATQAGPRRLCLRPAWGAAAGTDGRACIARRAASRLPERSR